mmetsp:Transcript_7073/g.14951  ORF Transcript_7073/g.14951 Transcript_7073/m.14951 type:complete len:120 (-) Transcript_7073:18-377(-)
MMMHINLFSLPHSPKPAFLVDTVDSAGMPEGLRSGQTVGGSSPNGRLRSQKKGSSALALLCEYDGKDYDRPLAQDDRQSRSMVVVARRCSISSGACRATAFRWDGRGIFDEGLCSNLSL